MKKESSSTKGPRHLNYKEGSGPFTTFTIDLPEKIANELKGLRIDADGPMTEEDVIVVLAVRGLIEYKKTLVFNQALEAAERIVNEAMAKESVQPSNLQ